MPRNPNNPSEFIAGKLPLITYNSQQYVVDGRLKQVRCMNDFSQCLDVAYDQNIWDNLSQDAKTVIQYEFHGVK